jgi:hypothetical protein
MFTAHADEDKPANKTAAANSKGNFALRIMTHLLFFLSPAAQLDLYPLPAPLCM